MENKATVIGGIGCVITLQAFLWPVMMVYTAFQASTGVALVSNCVIGVCYGIVKGIALFLVAAIVVTLLGLLVNRGGFKQRFFAAWKRFYEGMELAVKLVAIFIICTGIAYCSQF